MTISNIKESVVGIDAGILPRESHCIDVGGGRDQVDFKKRYGRRGGLGGKNDEDQKIIFITVSLSEASYTSR